MTIRPLTILAIFAHPDDEIGAGSTLAYYAEHGVRIVLACATRGEAATIYCDECATPETLAQVRTEELQCACEHLGIQELRWLDWPDGGIKDLPHEQALEQLVHLIRRVRPDVVLTHPENGLYPHPDHLAVWRLTREAFEASSNPAAFPGTGAPWAPARLFTRALPQSILDRAPALKDFRVELNGELLPFLGIPDDDIDVRMHVAAWVPRRMAAWECHRSQHNPQGFSTTMPDGLRQEMAEIETYLLAAARLPLPAEGENDLLAGLGDVSTSAPADEEVPVDEALVVDLIRELAAQRAIGELIQRFNTRLAEQKYGPAFRRLATQLQEANYRLARALRVAGEPPGEVQADPTLLRKASAYERPEQQARFLIALLEQSVARFSEHAHGAADAEQRLLWTELIELEQAELEALQAVT